MEKTMTHPQKVYRLTTGDIAKEMVMGCLTDKQYSYWRDAEPTRFENHLIDPLKGEVHDDMYIGKWYDQNDLFSLYATEFSSDNYLKLEQIDAHTGVTLTTVIDMPLGDRSFLERTFTVLDGHTIGFDVLDNGKTSNFFFGEAVYVGVSTSMVFEMDDLDIREIEMTMHCVEGEDFVEVNGLVGNPLVNHITERKTLSYCFMLNRFRD